MLARMGERLRTLELPDGRTLAYATWGDPDGFPVLALHGTPGCRFNRWPVEEVYVRAGVHWVTHDRAGYGRSDRHHGRNVADEAADVAALADELGLDRFGVTGGSGGGPHVLACAALLPDRVVRAVCTVGVAPFGPTGLEKDEWVNGMDPENVKEIEWAIAGEEVLAPELEREHKEAEERVAADPTTVLGDFELSESDRAELARPESAQVIREVMAEEAVNGVGGWVDDDLAFLQPWGFDVSTSSVPVLIRYGLTDVLVPPAHGEWLAANVPGCIVDVEDTAGHLGSDPEEEIAGNARWLSEGIAPEGSYTPSPTAA
jgi:pimeloyl-ACP methyl ester carboxylesterase